MLVVLESYVHAHAHAHAHTHVHVDAARVGRPPVVDTSRLSHTGAFLQWDPPEDDNGVITQYIVNVVAISTDPIATGGGAGTGGVAGGGNRRKRRQSSDVATECIVGGEEMTDVNHTVDDGKMTSLSLNNLSKLLHRHSHEIL